MKRRDFFKWMGAASSAAISACKVNDADKKIIPYLVPPEEGLVPGTPHYILTTCMECPAHCGIEVKIRDDKPVKLEGNPNHPVNMGALCIRGQASLANLYHPRRFKNPLLMKNGKQVNAQWPESLTLVKSKVQESRDKGLKSLYISSHQTGSLKTLVKEFCQKSGIERFKEFEIYSHQTLRQANKNILGQPVLPHYKIEKADLLISLGADLLETHLSPVEWHRGITAARKTNHLKWFHAEPYLSLTGASADHRFQIKPGSESYLLSYLIRNSTARVAIPGEILTQIPGYPLEEVTSQTGLKKELIDDLLIALKQSENPLILVGGPAVTGANGIITAQYTVILQWMLGMAGSTIEFNNFLAGSEKANGAQMQALAEQCRKGEIGVIIFSRPQGMDKLPGFIEAIKKVPFKVILSEQPGPVSEICDLVLPLSHYLESWGDAQPRTDLRSIIQPAIEPMAKTLSEGDILLKIMDTGKDYRDYLVNSRGGLDPGMLDRGFKEDEPGGTVLELQKNIELAIPSPSYKTPCLFITPSLRRYDGRGAGMDLLSEVPDPMTSITYGRWATISRQDARKTGLDTGAVIQISTSPGNIELPAIINPGLPPGILCLPIDNTTGLSLAIDKKTGDFDFCFKEIKFSKTGRKEPTAILAGAQKTGNRYILPKKKKDDHGSEHHHHAYTLYPPHEHKDYRWALVIDLDACSGCSACVAACYIENNVPMTGKQEHLRGREMSWLRMEAYYNQPGKPEFLPMMCQQCDNAPCETVCPVYATYHNPEGLNAQVYNRCVGTRYCANNCPYKVRRFNWFDHKRDMPLYTVSNPDLSVRPKGVMEKCSFCIQRIRFAKDRAKDEGRKVKDGDVIPACAQTCPAGAISFGNIMDTDSKVAQLIKTQGTYRVQELLGTQPAVYYIKKDKKG